MPLHSTNLDTLQEALAELTYDIDGLVFEMSKLSSLKLPLSIVHLNVARNIIEIYHKVKKHFRLSSYSCNWHRALKVCKGIVVARALGYEVVVALCPVPEFTCRRFSAQDIKAYQLVSGGLTLCRQLRPSSRREHVRASNYSTFRLSNNS